MKTNADIATELVEKLPVTIWAKACRDAVLYHDFTLLQRALPSVEFSVEIAGINQRTVVGKCADGSMAVWGVGLS